MFSTPLNRFRVTAFIEGISYLVLLFIAMPLKYFGDMPLTVTVAGSFHGGLFVAYVFTLAHVYFHDKWKFSQGFIAFVASLVPFSTFYLDAKLSRDHNAKLKLGSKLYLFTILISYIILLSGVYQLVVFSMSFK